MDEVVDESGDEHCLAGAGKACNAEPHGRSAAAGRGVKHVVKDNARLVGKGPEGRTRHLKEISDAISGCDVEQDHKRWDARRELVQAEIGRLKPDVMAFNEECIPIQSARDLRDANGPTKSPEIPVP